MAGGGMMILLDTCALLWLVNGGGKLTQTALEEIDRAPEVYISAISGFEISLKYHKGKLGLPLKPREWFNMAVEHHELSVISLDVETCMASTELPSIHQDPCDRFIIATAKLYKLPIVTADPRFQTYGVDVIC
jgi:PIN domain nuclease of toxin-antitoxin system